MFVWLKLYVHETEGTEKKHQTPRLKINLSGDIVQHKGKIAIFFSEIAFAELPFCKQKQSRIILKFNILWFMLLLLLF